MSERKRRESIRISDEDALVQKFMITSPVTLDALFDFLTDVKEGKVLLTQVFCPAGTTELCVVFRKQSKK